MPMTPDLQTATVELQSGSETILAYLARPAVDEPRPIVVVLQEVFGVNAHIREVSDRIAQAGYWAIAPHLYHRQVQNFEVGYTENDLALGRQYKQGTTATELLCDIQGAIAYARHCGASAQPAGCIGFCFGGHVAYLAATLPDIQATASFYGAGIVTTTPGGGEPTITQTPHIHGTLYGFFGTADPLIPSSDVNAIETALTQHHISHQIFRYEGATHGFFCDRRNSYDANAADHAWHQVIQLFATHLPVSPLPNADL